MESMKQSVVRQIEYYFSDENLIRGKFLKKKIEESEDGWIHLNILVKFKRLAALSTNVKFIGKALHQSNLNGIELSQDRQRVRRLRNKMPPIKNQANKMELISRSVYVDGFSKDITLEYLIDFFTRYSASHVILRKYFDKATKRYLSKGSAFITFPSNDQCEKFLKERVLIAGVPLITMHQTNFIANKEEKKLAKRLAKKQRNA